MNNLSSSGKSQQLELPEFNPRVPPPSINCGQQTYPSSYGVPQFPSVHINPQTGGNPFSARSFHCSKSPRSQIYTSNNFPNDTPELDSQGFFNTTTPPPPPPPTISSCVKAAPTYQPQENPTTVTNQCVYYDLSNNSQNSTSTYQLPQFPMYPAQNQNIFHHQHYMTPMATGSLQEPYSKQNNFDDRSRKSKFEFHRNEFRDRKWLSIDESSRYPVYKKQYQSKQIPFSRNSNFLVQQKYFNCKDSSSDSEGASIFSSRQRSRSTEYQRKERDYRSSSTFSSSSKYRSSRHSSSYSKTFRNENELRSHHKQNETERDKLLKTYRSQYCETSEEITKKLAELANTEEKEIWIRSSPAELFYRRTNNGNEVESTSRLDALCKLFEDELVKRAEKIKSTQEPYKPPERKRKTRLCKHKSEKCSSESSDDDEEAEEDCSMEELKRKINHPHRLHPDLWHNEPGEMNDGPLCRCSVKSKRTGIRHGIYPGEIGFPKCKLDSNNANKLYHYRITISPPTNFLTKTPTMIKYDQHEFLFEGFSLLSHTPIDELPTCKVIRFNIEYRILYIEEKMPEHFTIRELDIFFKYLFHELLELIDFDVMPSQGSEDSCSCFHFFPRFVRDLEDNGKEVLAMSEVLKYLLDSSGPLVDSQTLKEMMNMSQHEWQDYVDYIKGMVVTSPGHVPCSVRIDQLDRNVSDLEECVDKDENGIIHPVIVHFGIRPPQLSYAGNPEYQKARREYVRFRHLLANMSKPSYEDKRKLEDKENELQRMRTQGRMKRNITIAVSSKGFYRTGIMCDIVQHAMLIPVLTGHLRFHQSLDFLEKSIDYQFKNRYLLQLALTHPSYKENFGTNPDHARNSLTNCGIRQPEYGDRKIHYMNTRKRGINTLINIMSRFGKEHETASNITHNERLEFLGDAVVEFLSSIHLFFMFPDLEEGGLATYRAAIVQNQHLAVLAKKFHLDEFMLYAHGSDLCHELELRHAMANCFEALMGALLLDGGITVADKVFTNALFMENQKLKDVWENYPPHPLQEQEPLGDRQWIESYQVLKDLTKFEESIGVTFKHIRLLARAFTDRSIGFTHLTLGSNQRLEFLGDTVLQLICSEYLYRHFPEHHEGHLSLLRSSLVNNRTQAVVCDDLGMTKYAVYSNPRTELKTKDRADLLEAFLGALYVDKGLEYCQTFCHVCLFPRLQLFIMNQDWNDPKSKLQQCCLTLRTMEGGEPDIPYYKVIQSIGPTNTRVYTVAVYFQGRRLATAEGHSIQQAEMHAAKQALENSKELFPQLDHQKRVIVKSIKRQKGNDIPDDLIKEAEDNLHAKAIRKFVNDFDESHLPKQYRTREDISSDELSFDSNALDRDDDDDDDDGGDDDEHNDVDDNKNDKNNCSFKKNSGNRSSKVKTKKKNRNEKSKERENQLKNDSKEEEEEDDDGDDEEEEETGCDLDVLIDSNLSSLSDTDNEMLVDNFDEHEIQIDQDIELIQDENESEHNKSTFEKDVSCFKIDGAEELSSDMESGEIV